MALNYLAHGRKNLKLLKSLKTLTSSPPHTHELVGGYRHHAQLLTPTFVKKISKGLIQACEVSGAIPTAVNGKIPTLELSLDRGSNAQKTPEILFGRGTSVFLSVHMQDFLKV